MSGIESHEPGDSVPSLNDAERGKPVPTHDTTAEQAREARVCANAHDVEASNRERMVKIGRGNQQAGRQHQ